MLIPETLFESIRKAVSGRGLDSTGRIFEHHEGFAGGYLVVALGEEAIPMFGRGLISKSCTSLSRCGIAGQRLFYIQAGIGEIFFP